MNSKLKANRRGSVAVEAALIMPFLIIVTLGAIDISQYINLAQLVTNASREGARIASRHSTSTVSDVESVVTDYLSETCPQLTAEELDNALLVTVSDANGVAITNGDLTALASGEEISVRVDFDFSVIRWLQGPDYSSGNVNVSETYCRRE